MDCEKTIPKDILIDLCSRFVINVPEEEQSDLIRICFQVELAHWFYIDFYSKNFPHKRPCGFKEFTIQVFKHIPYLKPFTENVDHVIEEWKDYKYYVPTFGAILLDDDLTHVLLVQNYKSCWGFPKGKVNKEEPPHLCAIREVYEETGFDTSNLIDPNNYLEVTLNERVIRLYVIPGVSKAEKFAPRTRNEIKAVSWFPISDIPLSKKDAAYKQMKTSGTTSNAAYNAFYMVSPFMRKLWQWIYEHQNNIPHRRRRERHKSCSDIDKMNTTNLNDSVEMLRKLKKDGINEVEVDRTEEATSTYGAVPERVAKVLNGLFLEGSNLNLRHYTTPPVSNELYLNMNDKEPIRGEPSQLTIKSAFTKVEETKRKKREAKQNPAQRQRIQLIPSLINFQFDISLILQKMNEAVTMRKAS